MRILLALLVVFAGLCWKSKADGTNSNKLSKEQTKQFDSRVDELSKLGDSKEDQDRFEEGIRLLQREYPSEGNSYYLMMAAIGHREHYQQTDKAKALAKEMSEGSAPDKFKTWARGATYRLESLGKPIALKFTAVDGREVDLSKMKGKVVLIDFWATWCGPCVEELPRVKAAYDRFKSQGLEVIGVSCDDKKETLIQFLEKKNINWPQHLDGKSGIDNKLKAEFGINGIPHMFLVDKQGQLRFDNVRAKNGFEEQIAKLLAE